MSLPSSTLACFCYTGCSFICLYPTRLCVPYYSSSEVSLGYKTSVVVLSCLVLNDACHSAFVMDKQFCRMYKSRLCCQLLRFSLPLGRAHEGKETASLIRLHTGLPFSALDSRGNDKPVHPLVDGCGSSTAYICRGLIQLVTRVVQNLEAQVTAVW